MDPGGTSRAPGSGTGGDAPKKGGSSTLLIMLAVVGVVFLLFNQDVREQTANYVGLVLDPVLADVPPAIALFFVGSFMVLANTVVRHFFTDWVNMARVQDIMRTFQREMREAQKDNNTYRIKRLTDMQPEIMKMQADMSTAQLKPMVFTMLIILPVFAWLFHFIDPAPGACDTFLRVPWSSAPGSWCADNTWWILPRWILIYSLFSIPIGQLVQRALKLWEFRHADVDGDGVPAGNKS